MMAGLVLKAILALGCAGNMYLIVRHLPSILDVVDSTAPVILCLSILILFLGICNVVPYLASLLRRMSLHADRLYGFSGLSLGTGLLFLWLRWKLTMHLAVPAAAIAHMMASILFTLSLVRSVARFRTMRRSEK